MSDSTSTSKSATASSMDYQKLNHDYMLDTLVERNASKLAERLERLRLSKGAVGVGRASNGGRHEGNKVSEELILPSKRNAHSGARSESGDGQSKAESGSGDGQSENGSLLPLKERVGNIRSMHDNKGKGMYGKRFGPIEDEGQNATLHEVYIPVNKNGYGQSPAESKNGDGQSTAGSKNGDGQSLAESKSRDGQSLAESKSRDGQSLAESKSGDGRNIYYLHTKSRVSGSVLHQM